MKYSYSNFSCTTAHLVSSSKNFWSWQLKWKKNDNDGDIYDNERNYIDNDDNNDDTGYQQASKRCPHILSRFNRHFKKSTKYKYKIITISNNHFEIAFSQQSNDLPVVLQPGTLLPI